MSRVALQITQKYLNIQLSILLKTTMTATSVRRNATKHIEISETSRSSARGEGLHKEMTAFATRLSKDPDAARDFLKRAGIVTRGGKVAKAYGG